MVTTSKPANTKKAGKRPPPKNAWKPGQSGNPAGAPKRGESWAEIIKAFGDLTPNEAADKIQALAVQLRKYGGQLTLKQAVVARVYAALLFDPQAGLLNAFMDRSEGKVADRVRIDGALEVEGLEEVLDMVYGRKNGESQDQS
jgi:hypothetical protein